MSSLFICIKQKSDFLKNNYILIILVDFMRVYYDFFATRTRFHVSWSGSGSGQMIRIQPDPDPKHCFHNFLQYNTAPRPPPPPPPLRLLGRALINVVRTYGPTRLLLCYQSKKSPVW